MDLHYNIADGPLNADAKRLDKTTIPNYPRRIAALHEKKKKKRQNVKGGRYTSTLQENYPCILGVALARTIWAFEPVALAQTFQRVLRNDMSTRHHHGRVVVGRLFLGYWTDKDGME